MKAKINYLERAKGNGAVSLDELKDELLGKTGTKERDKYEFQLSLEILAHKLQELRKHKKITQTELAKKLGYSNKSKISKLETNSNKSNIETYINAFEALGFSIIINVVENGTNEIKKTSNKKSRQSI